MLAPMVGVTATNAALSLLTLPVDPSSGELVDQRLEATPFGSSGAPRSCIPPSAVTITTGGEMPGACVMFSEGSSAPTTQHHH